MTNEQAIEKLREFCKLRAFCELYPDACQKDKCEICIAIEALEQKPRKGEWLRMSDLSEQEDDRYKCSRCGNVIHHKNKMNLYTFNSWCGRCGSDNGRHINYEVKE